MDLWNDPVFLMMVGVLDECVLTLDDDGRVTGARCQNEEMLPPGGHEAMLGRGLDEVFSREVAAAMHVALQALDSTGLPQTVNFHLVVRGQERHFYARLARPAVDATRQTLVAIWDVTRHVLSQQTMLESEAFYRLLAENSTDVIALEELDGRYLYVSPSIVRLTGHEPSEVIGRYRHEFLHGEDLARMKQEAGGEDGVLVPPPEGGRVRFRLRRRDDSWIWVESTVRTFEWQGRRTMLSIVRDISRRKRAEDELQEARRTAESANRAKSALLASISHDLRTPLHGILGMAELLEQTHLTPEQQEYLAAVQESGDTLLARLNDLLDFSKIESGKLDLQVVDFEPVEAVEGLLDILGNQAAAKGIDLFCHVHPEVPPVVRGDPQRLRQVLINLIGNAIKFTNEGEVDVRATNGEPGRLRFTVRDTGVGLRQEQMDQLRGVGSEGAERWRRPPGGGLGLTIARQLVELMGGELVLETGDRGSTFSFELPLPASDRTSLGVQAQMLAGRRVLATDDNPTNRQLIREYLEQAGAEVELTSGGVETIRNLLDDPAYECVVLNAHLPDLDGFATAAMIRANRTLEALPLVLMISSVDSGEVRRSKELEVNAVLTKPVRRDVLVRAVHDVIVSGGHQEERTRRSEGTVLVVEDNELNMRLARDILRRAGYGVVSARDGKEALGQLEKHHIDAVLMDIQLPDMDGIEATTRIRRTPAWARIPIIAMTAHAMKGDAERFLGAGVDDCLSKPVNQLELLRALEREISRRSRAAAE